MSFFAFNWDPARKKNTFIVWEALLKLSGSCDIREIGCEIWEMGYGKQTAFHLAKVIAVCLQTFYKVNRGKSELFHP